MSLTFKSLRKANIARLPEFKNSQGGPVHSAPDGSDWSLLEWAETFAGEVGKLANLLKKIKRGDLPDNYATFAAVAKEIADVQIYLDLLAFRAGIDLDIATAAKFNETSRKIGSSIRIDSEGNAVRRVGVEGIIGHVGGCADLVQPL